MKKLIILLLVCVPLRIFAQESPALYVVINEKINNSYADFRTDKVVYTSLKRGLTIDKEDSSNQILLNPTSKGDTEDNWFIINENLFKGTDANRQYGMVSFTKDKKTVFFSVNRKIKYKKKKNEKEVKIKNSVNLQLFKANVDENGKWVNLEMLPFNSNRFSTGQPTLNQDDTKLYFVSDGPESLGRTDIYVVDLFEDGTYGEPVNLGPKINSKEREIFPFVDKDNLLYFSSDVRNMRGDLDVFACKIFDNTISTPVKLKGSVNIEKNDLAYDIDDEKLVEYFSSNRILGKEVADIYSFINSSPIDFECHQEVKGVVKNGFTNELLPNVQVMLFDSNNNKITSFLSGENDASFSFKQTCNTNFKLKGYLDGFLVGEIDVKTVNDLNAKPVKIVMKMHVDPNRKIELMTNSSKVKGNEVLQNKINRVEKTKFDESIKKSHTTTLYDFNSSDHVYTIQIGAFLQKPKMDKYNNLTSFFNHRYDDGFDRYYSGIFMTYGEAINYLKLMQKDGFQDAFVVSLKGEKRF